MTAWPTKRNRSVTAVERLADLFPFALPQFKGNELPARAGNHWAHVAEEVEEACRSFGLPRSDIRLRADLRGCRTGHQESEGVARARTPRKDQREREAW